MACKLDTVRNIRRTQYSRGPRKLYRKQVLALAVNRVLSFKGILAKTVNRYHDSQWKCLKFKSLLMPSVAKGVDNLILS